LKLKGIISESGVSQNEAAERIGVHYNTISAWVGCRSEPRPSRLIELLVALDWHDIDLNDFWSMPNGTS
jgi:transcriptional regulator with XRE-family HTH domain